MTDQPRNLRFHLRIGDHPCRSAADVRDHLHIDDLLEAHRSGVLRSWLEAHGDTSRLERVSRIDKDAPDDERATAVIKAFDVIAVSQHLAAWKEQRGRESDGRRNREEGDRRSQMAYNEVGSVADQFTSLLDGATEAPSSHTKMLTIADDMERFAPLILAIGVGRFIELLKERKIHWMLPFLLGHPDETGNHRKSLSCVLRQASEAKQLMSQESIITELDKRSLLVKKQSDQIAKGDVIILMHPKTGAFTATVAGSRAQISGSKDKEIYMLPLLNIVAPKTLECKYVLVKSNAP